jgi:hypothetical protein
MPNHPRKRKAKRTVKLNPALARFDQANEVRAIARERVGTVKPSRPILPEDKRKKPKHKKPPGSEE